MLFSHSKKILLFALVLVIFGLNQKNAWADPIVSSSTNIVTVSTTTNNFSATTSTTTVVVATTTATSSPSANNDWFFSSLTKIRQLLSRQEGILISRYLNDTWKNLQKDGATSYSQSMVSNLQIANSHLHDMAKKENDDMGKLKSTGINTSRAEITLGEMNKSIAKSDTDIANLISQANQLNTATSTGTSTPPDLAAVKKSIRNTIIDIRQAYQEISAVRKEINQLQK